MAEIDDNGTTAGEVEGWVRDEMHLGADASITISEKPGTDPRCGPVVTEVLISAPDEEPYAFHIERPLHELEPMDVIAAIAFGGGH